MAHMMKHTKASCGHMFAHFDRKAEHISNENLDRTRTHLNYNLATHQQMDQGEFVRQRCSEVRCQNRKDVNVMVSWVITAPKDLPEQEQRAFFKASYDFCKERYGEENVVSAYVHMDEVTPHMHFAFVPIVQDKKRGGYKVSAKECVNRSDLQTYHKDLEAYVSRELGHEVGILNEATKDGNMTTQELKYQSAVKRTEKAEQLAERAENRLNDLQGRILRQEEVNALNGKKTLTGGLKGVSYEEYLSLKKTAQNINKAQKTVKKLKSELEQVKKERDSYKSKSESIDLQRQIRHSQEISDLKSQLEKEKRLRKTERNYYVDVVNSLSPEAKQEFAEAEQKVREQSRQNKLNRNRGMHL